MKKLFFIATILFFFSCGNEEPQRPDPLLSEQQMENILYDLALLQTMSSVTPTEIQKNGIDVKNYIYNKYSIDSLTLAENQEYYAYDLENFQKIHKRVVERLKAEQAALDSVNTKNLNKKPVNKRIIPAAK